MSIRFVIGRAGCGKSEWCLNELRAQLQENAAGSPMILLVPEQATFQAEYALVRTPGISGFIRAQVLSFRRMAFRIMQEVGGSTRVHIADTGKTMLLHKIVHNRKNNLRLFYSSADQMGFIEKVNNLFKELKRYCITAALFEEHVNQKISALYGDSSLLEDKLHDLLLIYLDFEAHLSQHYVDSEDYLTILAEQLQHSDYAREAEVWIDGFYGFTPQEFVVIEQMMLYCRKVTVTLCLNKVYEAGDRPQELDLFHPTATTMIGLQQLIEQTGVLQEETIILSNAKEPRLFASPALAYLEQNFAARIDRNRSGYAGYIKDFPQAEGLIGQQGKENTQGVVINAAVHRRAEVEGAAREITRLVREQGYRWRDVAVMVRNIEDYHDPLVTILQDYGIPFFLDQKRSVMFHPLVEFIRSALEVVVHNWRYDAVFRCVKTDFLLPLDSMEEGSEEGAEKDNKLVGLQSKTMNQRHGMDELENYILAFGIHGSRWTDGQLWTYKLHMSLEEEKDAPSEVVSEDDIDAESPPLIKQDASLQQINFYRQLVVAPLYAFQKQIKEAANIKQMVEALFALLESIQVPERLEQWSVESNRQGQMEQSREHSQMWESVIDLLDQVVEMMGEEAMSIDLFANIIETGLESIKLGLVPPALDQVLIGSLDRSRSSHIKASFVLGVNEGIMPSRVPEDGILSEKERLQLSDSGLELAPGSRRKLLDEQFLIYTALCTPQDFLWLSYPLADEEGKSLLPSELIRQVSRMFPMLKQGLLQGEPSITPDNQEQIQYLSNPDRVLSYLLVQLRQWKRGTPIADIWWEVYNWFSTQPVWEVKLKKITGSLFYSNQERPLSPNTSLLLYGQTLQASVSRMERFVACPFTQFISHGLRLQERRIHRLEAPDIGQLFHAALTSIALQLQAEQLSWGALTADQCRELAAEAINRISPRLQSEILSSSKRFSYITRKLKEIVSRTAIVLGEHTRMSAFTPVGLELDFGPEKTLPSLKFDLHNGSKMDIVGRIDRVDRADDERGMMLRIIDYKSSQTSLQLSNVFYGLSLQMLTYLDVVITHAEAWLGQKASPAGVLYFHVHNPLLQKNQMISPEQVEKELFKRYKMKGLVHADRQTIQLMDVTLDKGISEIIPVGLKTNGEFYSSSAIVTGGQWGTLNKHVRHVISEIGTGITNGVVEIHPYRMGPQIACTFCSYKSICQFDPLFEDNEYKELARRGKDDLWRLIEANAARAANDFKGGATDV